MQYRYPRRDLTATITITEFASMPGRYRFSLQAGRTTLQGHDAGQDPAAAAAKAVELAIAHGRWGYVILAPQKVLDFIPAWLRERAPDGAD